MTNDEADQLIADCIARESRLSESDRTMIDSFAHQREGGATGFTLTERQCEILERIWTKATAKG